VEEGEEGGIWREVAKRKRIRFMNVTLSMGLEIKAPKNAMSRQACDQQGGSCPVIGKEWRQRCNQVETLAAGGGGESKWDVFRRTR